MVTVHMPKDRVVKPQAANEVTAASENSQTAERKHAEQKRAAFLQMQLDAEQKRKTTQSA